MHGPCLGSGQPSNCINTFSNKISMIRMNHLLNRILFLFLTLYCLRYLVCLNVIKNFSGGKNIFICFSFLAISLFYCEKE